MLHNIVVPRDHSMADWYHERLELHIQEFRKNLSDDEDMSVTVVLNDGKSVTAAWFGYHNPNMITVDGIDERGNEVEVLLPHTNIQVVLAKTKKEKAAARRPIGFQTREQESEPPSS